MLKKRILASSMASVMALTSVCAVAFADEAFDPDAQQSVTKDQLKTYLESTDIKSKIDSSAQEYGTISAANFLRACAFAQKVIDGEYDTYSDVFSTVAFQMVRAERAKLVQYTNVQLNDLVKTYKSVYSTGNRLNEQTNDLIYTSDSWIAFADKYEEAQTMENATDIRVTTDVYEELVKAFGDLSQLETKTKSEIEAAKKAYELAIKGEYKYQPWARGTVSGTNSGFDGKQYSWGALFSYVNSGASHVFDMYDKFDRQEYKGVTITSNPDIVKAVNDMNLGAKALNSFSCALEAGTDTKTGTLLRRYQGQLVYTYNRRSSHADITGNANGLEYNDQAIEMLDELADKVKKDGGTKGDTVKVETRLVKTAEPSLIYYKDVLTGGTGANAYEHGAWNITTADMSYSPLGGGSHSHTKVISAELKARIDSSVNKGIYVIETVEKNVANQGTYVRVNTATLTAAKTRATAKKTAAAGNTTLVATYEAAETALQAMITAGDEQYFFVAANVATAKAMAECVVESLPNPSKYKGAQINTSRDLVLSNCVAVDSTDILDLENAGGTGAAYRTAKANHEKAEYDLKVALAAAKDADDVSDIVEATATAAGSASGADSGSLMDAYNTAYDAVYGALSSGTRPTGGTKRLLDAAYATYIAAADVESFTRTHAGDNSVADGIYGDTTGWTSGSDSYTGCAATNGVGLSTDYFNWTTFGGATTEKGISAGDAITYKRDNDAKVVPISPNITYAVFLYDQYTARETNTINKETTAASFTPGIGMQAGTAGAYFIKTIDAITDVTTVSGNSTPEWKLIYNYLQYALSDKFDGETGTLKVRRDVQELINKSYDLVQATVETPLFSFSNMDLVEERDLANGWDKNADLYRKDYKDNVTAPDYDKAATLANSAYNNLNGRYTQLNNEYNAFKYSYKDIANDISRIAKSIDASDPNNEALIKAVADVADKMVRVEVVKITRDGNDLELEDSKALTEDGDFKYNNRNYTTDGTTSLQTEKGVYSEVKSSKGGANQTHYDLRVAYENMLELVKRKKGDVNNDGKINAADAVLVLQDAADIKKLDDSQKSYADMNGDGKITAADATEILKLAMK